MKYYLCKFNENDSEGFGVSGFKVLNENEKKSLIQRIRNRFDNDCVLTLSNGEEIEFDDSDDALESLKFKKISEEEYWTIRRLFGNNGTFGEQGIMDEDNWEEEPETCSNCGCELEEWEHDLCESCEEEEQEDEDEEEEQRSQNVYNAYNQGRIKSVIDFIKKEFNLELGSDNNSAAYFKWMPTPKSDLTITIDKYTGNFGNNQQYIKMVLKHNNKVIVNQKLLFDDWNRRQQRLKAEIQELVNKAKDKFNG